MRRLAVINALDHAIAVAGKHELDLALHEPEYEHELPASKFRQVQERSNAMVNALRALGKPDYLDPLVADSHLLFYHPSHIALAYSMIANQVHRHPEGQLLRPGETKLHIIDLAAGNLAMQFGAAIAVGQAIERGQNIEEVRITNIDPSSAMLQAGYDAWNEFVSTVASDPALRPLQIACEMITSERLAAPWPIQQQLPGSECWISEMHGLYDDNLTDIRDEMLHLHQVTNPSTVMVTCYGTRNNRRRIDDAIDTTPFTHAPYTREEHFILRSATNREFTLPWEDHPWKPRDRHHEEVDEICHRYGIIVPESDHVHWQPPSTAILIWTLPLDQPYSKGIELDDLPF